MRAANTTTTENICAPSDDLKTVSFYDALDNRIGEDENNTQTWTLYDGSDPVMDFNGSGSLTMRYLNGPAGDLADTVLAQQTSGGTVSWLLADRLGTVRDVISNSGGIIDHVDFSAFGTVLAESFPSSGGRMVGFAGMERDTTVGLNLAVMRIENPNTGRWDSEDPLGFAAGDANLDRYVANSPAIYVDQSGEFIPLITGLLGAGAGALIGAGLAALEGGNILAGAGKGALIGGIAGATGGLVGAGVAGALGSGVIGGVVGGAVGAGAGDFVGQQTEIALKWRPEYNPYQTYVACALGGLARGPLWRPTNAPIQRITRWGSPGGNWWMTGGANIRNWVLAGGPDPWAGFPFEPSVTVPVPREVLRYPKGWECIKGLIGQRQLR